MFFQLLTLHWCCSVHIFLREGCVPERLNLAPVWHNAYPMTDERRLYSPSRWYDKSRKILEQNNQSNGPKRSTRWYFLISSPQNNVKVIIVFSYKKVLEIISYHFLLCCPMSRFCQVRNLFITRYYTYVRSTTYILS